MRRLLYPLLMSLACAAPAAAADPEIHIVYHDEVLRVTLDGSYAGQYYRVWRSDQFLGEYDPLANQYTLCTGDCYVADAEAAPGATYYYRFELRAPGGGIVEYGPYPVTVPDTPLGLRAWPNPMRHGATIDLSLPGSRRQGTPVPARAVVLDVQGRVVRTLFDGALSRGVTSVAWDGRNETGGRVGAGLYFVRFTTPLGARTARLVRAR